MQIGKRRHTFHALSGPGGVSPLFLLAENARIFQWYGPCTMNAMAGEPESVHKTSQGSPGDTVDGQNPAPVDR